MGKRFAIGAVLAAGLLAVGCTVQQSSTPPLAGPSELALSVNVTATPDSVALDGGSQSAIVVEARDASGSPRAALPVRLDILVGVTIQDCGQLSARNIVTGSDGRATSVFTAPALPLPLPNCANFSPGNVVTIAATPSGTNFQTASQRTATIRLVPTGVIVPPAGTPTASFSFSPSAPTANTAVQFNATASLPGSSASQITSYSWTFGDGSSGSGQTTSHTYAAGGTFNVTLTVTNDRGVSASSTQAVPIGAATLPTASFTFSPSAPGINESVFFNGSASTPGAGHTINSYQWTFGDGHTASGVTSSNKYATAGTYSAQLKVTDEVGQSATSAAILITVGQPPSPTARFTFSPQIPAANQNVTFDASTSTTSQGQTIQFYDWTFGDGTVAQRTTSPVTGHTFGFAGIFSVNLVVTDTAGRIGSTSSQITVNASDATFPTASFTFTPSPASVNQEVSFDAGRSTPGTGAATIVNYLWDFGDGTQLFGTNVATVGYTYRKKGTFIVKLTVTNNVGKSSSTTQTIVVQ